MLILSRRPGDAILIDGEIRVVVLACDQRGVRLGIEAPATVGIVREEIVTQIADENRRASNTAAAPWLKGIPPLPKVARETAEPQEDTPPSTPRRAGS
jgi:carbon storage regulator